MPDSYVHIIPTTDVSRCTSFADIGKKRNVEVRLIQDTDYIASGILASCGVRSLKWMYYSLASPFSLAIRPARAGKFQGLQHNLPSYYTPMSKRHIIVIIQMSLL